ncbi:VOC family protein [Sphingomonas colocasiae]|uniref:VOC family protein n=1 Tax=Sphingomonas colocasiae TaxID=1848973 RepID=A0ABS7PQK2_9SPHN|nr:VOC family protein [Sphingomonas colocasiae]
MAELVPQLEFDGQCREAFERYAALFGGEITVMNTLGETGDVPLPPGSTAGAPDMVRFAELRLGDTRLLGNDLPADQYASPRGFNLAMHFETADEARRIFDGLADGGSISVAPTKVAWAALFGMVTDRFGIPWLILGFED